MVDGVFMVDGPSINHGQKAINHKSWLMGRLREWLMVGLNMGLDMVYVSDQSNPYRPDSEIRDGGWHLHQPHESWLMGFRGSEYVGESDPQPAGQMGEANV